MCLLLYDVIFNSSRFRNGNIIVDLDKIFFFILIFLFKQLNLYLFSII